jgi:DNA polymerase-3 subunit alpha
MASCRVKDLAKQAAKDGQQALALTDLGNMFAAIQHYFACKEAGIKPILGQEVYIAPKGRFVKAQDQNAVKEPNRRLVLLAQNLNGYRNLCKISSLGYHEGFYYVPRVDYDLLSEYSEDLIALSGGIVGDVPWTFINKGEEEANELIEKIKGIYGDRFYLELNRTGLKDWREINKYLIQASDQFNVPLVAANDVHYLKSEDKIAQEVLVCIGTNKTLQDESRFKLGSNQFYFKSQQEMIDLFKDIPEAIENTQVIADRCNLEFELTDQEGKPIYHLPNFPTKDGASIKEEIRRIAFEGLQQRFLEKQALGTPVDEEKKTSYFERLEYELGIIDQMGFNGYFLIVQDFINWSKEHDIPVGPGRGSGAGSLVAFCLRITDLDPLPYNLIFERFLNPERVSMPDFDIDFCQEGRGRVIDYVTEKYGQKSVSQIITYGKLQARAAIRDVGRVMGMTYAEVDVVSKLMPDVLGITLTEAIEQEPRLKELMEQDSRVQTLMDLAKKIEGLTRHAGIHAAGVVIADGDIDKISPLTRGADGEYVVQYDMKHAEKVGLIKFDFLGLKTLTHINDAFKLIKRNRGKDLSPNDISLSDAGIYKLMSKGETGGVFQFEGDGMRDMLKKGKPDCFEDIVAATALYRPGPMAMIPDYLDRKHGRKKEEYLFEELEPILKETYGIVVYQEQVQLIAAKIANYSLGEADLLRRAMGKKIAEEMEKQKKRFMNGAEENGYDAKKAEQLFDSMAEFAKYGFNKSHAAAYCVISAQTAWLRNYYPVEFFAALLSTEMSDTDKIVKYVKDAQSHGIEVLPPHINYSDYKFSVDGDRIFFSLGAIKGVGQAAVESILQARESLEDKKFESIEHFFEVVDLKKVNKKTLECLIKAGAFDGFGANRAELLAGYGKFIERADRVKKDIEHGQASLFSMDANIEQQQKVFLESRPPWRRSARLEYEKSVLGFYLSDHPLKGIEHLTSVFTTGLVDELKKKESKSTVRVAGLISSLREIITKKGTRMAFAQLEDLSGSVELVIFPDAFAESELIVKGDGVIVVTGAVEVSEDKTSAKILVEKIERFNDRLKQAKKVIFHIDEDLKDKIEVIKSIMEKYPGQLPTSIRMSLADIKKTVDMDILEPTGLGVSNEFLEEVGQELGKTDFVQLVL